MSKICPKEWRSVRLKEPNDEMIDCMKKLRQSMVGCDKSWSESKNLMYFNDNRLFIWQPSDQCVYCCALKDESNITNITDIQCLILTNAPLFDVESLEMCGIGRYLAVSGLRGINVVELPPKWGLNGAYEGGKVSVMSRSWALGQRFFVCNQNIELLCMGWHPNSPQQQHIVLLTNDNSLRIFDIKDEEIPIQVIDLSTTDGNASLISHFGVSAFASSLGENAVSFDFGPTISKGYDIEPSTVNSPEECLTPIYVLRGNGDVLLIYSSLKYSYVSNTVFGPLTMRPPAEDNYGVDACSIVCLDSMPPVLVIATSFGVVHHCIALNSDESNANHSLLPQPTLYVYETIELSLSLTTSTGIEDTSCALRLHKDRMIPMRYFCSHSCGLHVISVPFVSQLKSKDEINFRDEESIIEHLICTKPIGASDSDNSNCEPTVPLGVAVGVHNCYTFVLVMFSDGELLCRRLTPSYISHVFDDEVNGEDSKPNTLSDISVPKLDFNEYIKQLLKRNTTLPLLKSSKEMANNEWSQNLELLLTTTDILKTEYIKKYDLVSNAIDKRAKVLSNDKQIQLKELNKCLTEKDLILQSLLVLVEKYDKTRERQERLSNRIDKVLELLQFERPELSDAEIQLRDQLKRVSDRLSAHKNKLQQIKVKCKYQTQNDQQLDKNGQHLDTSRAPAAIPSPNQIKSIREMLSNQGQLIAEMVESINSFEIK